MKKALIVSLIISLVLLLGCDATFHSTEDSEGTISGVVKESDLRKPIDGAEVCIIGYYMSTTTRDGGQFLLEHVPIGEQIVRIKHDDYMTKEITTRIFAGETTPLTNIELRDIYVDKVIAYDKATNVDFIKGKPDNACVVIPNSGYIVVDLGSGEEAASGSTYGDFYIAFKEDYADSIKKDILIGVSNYETGPFQRCEWNTEGVSITGTGYDKVRFIKIEFSGGEEESEESQENKQIEIDYIRVLNYENY